MSRTVVLLAVLFSSMTLAYGQQPAGAKPCAAERHAAFDFWVGAWDVSTGDGKRAGENEISSHGCFLLESWKGVGGSRGMSLNFVDPADGKWTQDWVDNSGGRILIKGDWQDGAMRLNGEHTLPDGTKRPFRGTWTPLADGRVRQHFEEVADPATGWATWFDGYYVKRGAD